MQTYSLQLTQTMRTALDDAMTKVPQEYANTQAKAYLAECIAKAAAQGQTDYGAFVAIATGQIPKLAYLLS
jgi:hypothetical protein